MVLTDDNTLIVDVSSIVYRAFFALPHMDNGQGVQTNAVFGFIKTLNSVIKSVLAKRIFACMDSRENIRKDEFESYKANRPTLPDGLYQQLPYVEKFLKLKGITVLKRPGYEADDIIFTLVNALRGRGKVFILSSDKDLAQLVSDNVFLCTPSKSGIEIMDKQKVKERFGVGPEKIVDFLCLTGDASDNIPGIKGIGPKTAAQLLERFGSLKEIIENAGKIEKKRIREAIIEGKGILDRNMHLICLRDAGISFEEINGQGQEDAQGLIAFYKELGFRSFLKEAKHNPNKTRGQQDTYKSPALINIKAMSQERVVIIDKGEDGRFNLLSDRKTMCPVDFKDKEVLKALASGALLKIISQPEEFFRSAYSHRAILDGIITEDLFDFFVLRGIGANEEIRDVVLSLQETGDEMARKRLQWAFSVEGPLAYTLYIMQENGIKIDIEALEQLRISLIRELSDREKKIFDTTHTEINLNSPKQIAFLLYEKLGLPVLKKGKAHPPTDEQTLRKLAGYNEIIGHLLEYRQLNKMLTAFVIPLLSSVGKDGKIKTTFSQVNTQTGRLSALTPNLQTVPIRSDWGKQIRKAFIPSFNEGFLISADYSQIELRILAHMSQDEALVKAFKEGADVHSRTAAWIFEKSEGEVSEEERDIAKRVNFGIIYGMSEIGLAEQIDVPVQSAKLFIQRYFNAYPKVAKFIENTVSEARLKGYVETLNGFRRSLPGLESKKYHERSFAERAAVNTVIQGTAAEVIKRAMVEIQRTILEKGFNARMVLQVHDELLFDVPQEEVPALSEVIREKMENAEGLSVPLIVDIEKGKNWLEMAPL